VTESDVLEPWHVLHVNAGPDRAARIVEDLRGYRAENEAPEPTVVGTAVHAALEVLFSAEKLSAEVEAQAKESFARELGGMQEHPEAEGAFKRALALAKSIWGQRAMKVAASERMAERPFRWRIELAGGTVTLCGQIDLLLWRGAGECEVIDRKPSTRRYTTSKHLELTTATPKH